MLASINSDYSYANQTIETSSVVHWIEWWFKHVEGISENKTTTTTAGLLAKLVEIDDKMGKVTPIKYTTSMHV